LLTGKPLRAYLLDPLVKAGISPVARPILEQALGYDSPARYEHCGPLRAALRAARDQCAADTPQDHQHAQETDGRVSADSSAPGTAPHGSPLVAQAETPPLGTAPPAKPSRRPAELPFARLAHFRILRPIGHGGMGDVYERYDESLHRHVAVKVLPADLARDETFLVRFGAEARAAGQLDHPNVVSVHFFGEDQGYHFFAMDLVSGESLAARLQRQPRLPLEATLRIIEQCLAGLQAAHEHGLVHRDVKPGNTLLKSPDDHVVLVDFGLVRRIAHSLQVTATGMVMGTVDYLSPEQARGRPVDARADLYSLGVVFYRLLAGRLPFTAETPTAMLFQHAYEPPFPLAEAVPELPPPIVAIVERLLAKDPAERYQDCAAVLADLQAFRAGQPSSAPESPASSPPPLPKCGSRHTPSAGPAHDHRPAVHGFARVGQDLQRRLELTQLLGRLGGGRRLLGGRLLRRRLGRLGLGGLRGLLRGRLLGSHRSVLSRQVLRSRVATNATQQDSQLPRGRKKLKRISD
jgi:serine/threonine protein kinase